MGIESGSEVQNVSGYHQPPMTQEMQLQYPAQFQALIENEEYNGRRRIQAEKWAFYKQLRVIAIEMLEALMNEDKER